MEEKELEKENIDSYATEKDLPEDVDEEAEQDISE